jgi:hypothetical protein
MYMLYQKDRGPKLIDNLTFKDHWIEYTEIVNGKTIIVSIPSTNLFEVRRVLE